MTVRTCAHVMVLTVCGDVDPGETAALRRTLIEALRARPKHLVIDLAGVTELDHTAVGALQATADSTNAVMQFIVNESSPIAGLLRTRGIAVREGRRCPVSTCPWFLDGPPASDDHRTA